ncbi:OmpR/PhoB-type domain-containing protein [Bordetella tumbae]|uniref:helix-turn-helix domain-containing protein n=1 Tax=Bordetella tumbae TaxID=1649139 RepID=UPI0039F0EA7D
MPVYLSIDDASLAHRTKEYLGQFGYSSVQIESSHPVASTATQIPSLGVYIVDVRDDALFMRLPKFRSESPHHFVLAIGAFNDEAHKSQALLAGADACLNSDFGAIELAANLHTFFRKHPVALSAHSPFAPCPRPEAARSIKLTRSNASAPDANTRETWALCHDSWILQTPAGSKLELSKHERRIFIELYLHPDTPVDLSSIEQFDHDQTDGEEPAAAGQSAMRTLTVAISRLKKKAILNGSKLPLMNVRQQGYMFFGELIQK